MNKKYDLGNFICSLREEYDMDQKTLAQLLGVSPSAISQCENGGGIKTEKLFQLAELFGVTIDELLDAKRSNQTLEEKLDSLYDIRGFDLPELITVEDIDTIKEFYNRVEAINDNFYKLLSKWILGKMLDDEYKELCYLWKYFKTTDCINKYIKKLTVWFNEEECRNNIRDILSKELNNLDKQTIDWELKNIFTIKIDLHIDEIIKLIVNDDRIESEQGNMGCFKALFNALPKLSQDLIYSQMAYNDGNTLARNVLGRIMAERGANLLYLPKLRNIITVKEDVFRDFDGEVEFDESLTNAMKIYRDKYINDFKYQSWTVLTYAEYRQCVDKNQTADLKTLVSLQKEDMTAYWEKYKSMKYHIEQLKRVEL